MQAMTAITMNTTLMAHTRSPPTIGVIALQIVGAIYPIADPKMNVNEMAVEISASVFSSLDSSAINALYGVQ